MGSQENDRNFDHELQEVYTPEDPVLTPGSLQYCNTQTGPSVLSGIKRAFRASATKDVTVENETEETVYVETNKKGKSLVTKSGTITQTKRGRTTKSAKANSMNTPITRRRSMSTRRNSEYMKTRDIDKTLPIQEEDVEEGKAITAVSDDEQSEAFEGDNSDSEIVISKNKNVLNVSKVIDDQDVEMIEDEGNGGPIQSTSQKTPKPTTPINQSASKKTPGSKKKDHGEQEKGSKRKDREDSEDNNSPKQPPKKRLEVEMIPVDEVKALLGGLGLDLDKDDQGYKVVTARKNNKVIELARAILSTMGESMEEVEDDSTKKMKDMILELESILSGDLSPDMADLKKLYKDGVFDGSAARKSVKYILRGNMERMASIPGDHNAFISGFLPLNHVDLLIRVKLYFENFWATLQDVESGPAQE